MFGINKNLLITALVFGAFFTLGYGWFNNFVRPWLGALGMWADLGIMALFFVVFMLVYDKVVKRPVGV